MLRAEGLEAQAVAGRLAAIASRSSRSPRPSLALPRADSQSLGRAPLPAASPRWEPVVKGLADISGFSREEIRRGIEDYYSGKGEALWGTTLGPGSAPLKAASSHARQRILPGDFASNWPMYWAHERTNRSRMRQNRL